MRLSFPSCVLVSSSLLALAALLDGCAISTTASPETATGASIQGNVHGGSQPVVGAHVHLMAASAAGYGAAATSLLTSGTAGTDSIGGYVATTSTGSFTITGDYSCVAGTQVYVLATQGNPGLPPGSNNPNLALMSAIGQCPATGTFLATVPLIWINEVTTVASVYALSGFMTDLAHVGSSGTPLALTGIANASATAGNLVGAGCDSGGEWHSSAGGAQYAGEHYCELRELIRGREHELHDVIFQCDERIDGSNRYGDGGAEHRA